MTNNEMIVVKQLPIIEQQLQQIKAEVTAKTEDALSLVCTEETVVAIKKERAKLNKELAFWEEKRKEVKSAIMSPYEQFEAVYKDCISNVYRDADAKLKAKIDSVETELKSQKRDEVIEYFNEYLASRNISMPLTFDCANINVTMSASLKSLKEQAKSFIDRVCDDLDLIGTQEYKDEILYRYQKADGGCFLNASRAIRLVNEDRRAIEEAKAREAERRAREEAAKAAAEKVEAVIEKTAPLIEVPIVEEPVMTVRFTVKGTKAKLRELKEFLTANNYDFE